MPGWLGVGEGAKVTDEKLCNAATPADKCVSGNLQGVWVIQVNKRLYAYYIPTTVTCGER